MLPYTCVEVGGWWREGEQYLAYYMRNDKLIFSKEHFVLRNNKIYVTIVLGSVLNSELLSSELFCAFMSLAFVS